MTDAELIAKKLAFIETCVRELRDLCRPERLATDVKEARFAEHTLQIAIQAALDIASHIVSDERLGEPTTNRELFDRLARGGWISEALARKLHDAAGLRNLLVHGYGDVDLAIVRRVVEENLGDLLALVEAVRSRLGSG